MPDRSTLTNAPAVHHRLRSVALIAITALVVGCGSAAATGNPGGASPGTSGAGNPSTAGASASAAAPGAIPTFPPSQTAIAAGTYRWAGFERPVALDLGPGWELGHDDPAFFDLFRGSDFPSVSLARFSDVYTDATKRTTATDAALVLATLGSRTDVDLTGQSPIELGGLPGRQFDLTTANPQTPLFLGPAGDFKLDPDFKTRYRVLDFPGGGVLVVGVHTRGGAFDDGLALGDPVAVSLRLVP